MDTPIAVDTLSALAQPTRLEVFRLLVRQEPHGLAAGEIARRLDVPHNTMSTHLSILARAGLISVERHSRSMIYRVDLGTDPPPLKWSDLKYVLWHQGGSEHAKEEAHA